MSGTCEPSSAPVRADDHRKPNMVEDPPDPGEGKMAP
jgi:hypothetical protein